MNSFLVFIFLLELVGLFFLSRFLILSLGHILYRFFRHEQSVMYALACLFFPGTLIHELAHMFVAALLFVRVGKIELFPQRQGDSIKLGSVAIAHTDPFRRALIGLAPILVGLPILFYCIFYFGPLPLTPWYLNIIILVFILFEIANTMFSSKRDVEGIPALAIVLLIFTLVGYFVGIRLPESWLIYFSSKQVETILMQLIFYISLPLVLDGVLFVLAKVFTNRRQVTSNK